MERLTSGHIKWIGIMLFFIMPVGLMAQQERSYNRKANKAYAQKEYKDAVLNYQKAIKNAEPNNPVINNLAHAYFRDEAFEEAARNYQEQLRNASDVDADTYYNLGNALLQAGDYKNSIEAYKHALRTDPDHTDSKYNMSLARKMLLKQQKQQQQSGGGDQNKKQKQEQGDKEKKQDKKKQQNKQEQEKQEKQQKQDQAKKKEISREDAERMLKALEEEEKDLQKKLKKEKAEGQRVKTEKDW